MLRVALLCGRHRPHRDGVADYVAALAAALPPCGVHPIIAAAGSRRELEPKGVLSVATRWDAAGVAAAARTLRRLDVDLIHVQFAPSAFGYSPSVGLLPLGLGDIPLVTTLHEYGWWSWPPKVPPPAWDLLESKAPWDRETLALAPRSSRLIVTNPVHAEVVRARLKREPDVIPLGPNVEASLNTELSSAERADIRSAVRREFGIAANAKLLVFFGFVHPVKGLKYLLDGLPGLLERHPGAHLVVAGGIESEALNGAEAIAFENELREQIASLKLKRRVTLTGYLPAPRVSRLLLAGDVGVFPYTHGVTAKAGAVVAAQAHRLPVVATRSDPQDSFFVDEKNALLVERRDTPTLLAAVERVLSEPELAETLAENGHVATTERTWDSVAAKHARLYREVLDAAQPAPSA